MASANVTYAAKQLLLNTTGPCPAPTVRQCAAPAAAH